MRALKRLLNAAADARRGRDPARRIDGAGGLIGPPNQIEAVRAGMEKRAPRFADPA